MAAASASGSVLSRVRRSISPHANDTWESIAARELPALAAAEAAAGLQSWNLHVYMRAAARMGDTSNPILPSDIIFLEPPQAAA
jgi:hypothetical protein